MKLEKVAGPDAGLDRGVDDRGFGYGGRRRGRLVDPDGSRERRRTGGKQRLTSTRLHQLLVAEGLVASPRLVRREMAEWKRQRQEVFVPLVYRPGELAEVDFFEVVIDVAGQRQKAWMFLLRMMHSGRDFAWLYPRQDQVCFLDGHVRAFAHLGAVPGALGRALPAVDALNPGSSGRHVTEPRGVGGRVVAALSLPRRGLLHADDRNGAVPKSAWPERIALP